MVDTVLAAMVPTTSDMAMADMARGLQTLRLMPTIATEAMVDTDSAMVDTVTVVLDMAMANKQ